MALHGKIIFRKFSFEKDLSAIKIFCEECKKLGWENNSSLEKIKLEKTQMPYGQFFIGLNEDKIFTLAGVHQFPEINNNAWRCLFRGAQLPGYTPAWSSNLWKSSIHFTYMIYYQINFVQKISPNAEFYITTNTNNDKAGVSSRLDKIMMPRIEKTGIWSLDRKIILYGVEQNVWKINVEKYMKDREQQPIVDNFID